MICWIWICLLEMAYTQKKAERVITGLEKPVNDHLLKLWTISDTYDRGDLDRQPCQLDR